MTSADHLSQPDVRSRLLLRVLGFRTQGTAYRFDDDADQFWLALEGDAPDYVLWMKPDWRYFGPNFGFGMEAEKITLAYGEAPTLASNQFHFSPTHWQALCGMALQAVRLRTMYDPPHTAALSLQFAPLAQQADMAVNVATASLLFDAPDLDEPLSMLISDDANLGHWALRGDVQQHFSTSNVLPWEASWNAPWNTPPTPWNDRAHYVALAHFRAVLQDFAVWWQTQTEWAIPSRSRQGPAPGMWKAASDLCALQIVLGHQMVSHLGYGGWLDHDGEEYKTTWCRFEVAAAYTDLAQCLGEGITDWMRWMAWDEWHALLGSESGGLYVTTKACWQELRRAYMAWFQQFQKPLD